MRKIDYHMIKQALTGIPDECGDTGFISVYGNFCFLSLVDILGHGKTAFEIASLAETFLKDHHTRKLTQIIKDLHSCLQGTRGAVAAVCRLDLKTGILDYSGMGNISLRIFGSMSKHLLTKDGILGYMIPSPLEEQTRLHPGDILVMSSDGIRAQFDPIAYPDLFVGRAKEISTRFIRDLGKKNDDAACIVLRYGI
jgi:hypothetical protein